MKVFREERIRVRSNLFANSADLVVDRGRKTVNDLDLKRRALNGGGGASAELAHRIGVGAHVHRRRQ